MSSFVGKVNLGVSVANYPPYAFGCAFGRWEGSGDGWRRIGLAQGERCLRPGANVELVILLASLMGFRRLDVRKRKGDWEALLDRGLESNSTSAELERGVEMAGEYISSTDVPSRFAYSMPYQTIRKVLITRDDSGDRHQDIGSLLFHVLRRFSLPVWLLILTAGLAGTLINRFVGCVGLKGSLALLMSMGHFFLEKAYTAEFTLDHTIHVNVPPFRSFADYLSALERRKAFFPLRSANWVKYRSYLKPISYLPTRHFGFSFPKDGRGRRLAESVNRWLFTHSSSITDYFELLLERYRRWDPEHRWCSRGLERPIRFRPFSLTEFASAPALYAIVLFLSLLCLVAEIFVLTLS